MRNYCTESTSIQYVASSAWLSTRLYLKTIAFYLLHRKHEENQNNKYKCMYSTYLVLYKFITIMFVVFMYMGIHAQYIIQYSDMLFLEECP